MIKVYIYTEGKDCYRIDSNETVAEVERRVLEAANDLKVLELVPDAELYKVTIQDEVGNEFDNHIYKTYMFYSHSCFEAVCDTFVEYIKDKKNEVYEAKLLIFDNDNKRLIGHIVGQELIHEDELDNYEKYFDKMVYTKTSDCGIGSIECIIRVNPVGETDIEYQLNFFVKTCEIAKVIDKFLDGTMK